MAQSVKLSNGNYIDSAGVWDATRGKTQEDMNKALYVADAIAQISFGTYDSAYFTIPFEIAESARVGVLANIARINFQALPTGFELYTQAVGSSEWVPVIRTGNTLK